jgi:hypothetical protein
MRRIRLCLGAVAIVVVASGTFAGLSRIASSSPPQLPSAPGLASPPAPVTTPPPGQGVLFDAGAVDEGPRIPLYLPLPHPIDLPIGGKIFHIPAGATALEYIVGPQAIDVNTGEIVGGPISHPRFWLIARGLSSTKIDSVTGEVFDWKVKAIDRTDFQPLLNPSLAP